MQPLAGIIALQECVLAALILVSIPGAPTQVQWPVDAACPAGALNEVAARPAAPGCTLSDAIALVLFSCLIGFLLGRHSATAGWLLVPQQQPKVLQQHRSGWEVTSDNPNTAAVQLLQYAALAWQQLRHVLLAIAAAGAKCAAALLGLLAAKASDAAVAASDAAATAASHVRRQCGAQYVDAPGYDVSEDNDVDDGLSSVQDQGSAAPSFIAFLANNKQQRLSLQMQDPHEQQEQQQQVAAWRGMHSQPPAPPAAAAGDSLTFATPCNSSWNNSDACRTAATSSASACRTNYPAGSMCNGSTSSSSSRRTPVSRLDSGPLPMSGAASLNASVTPLGCGWMCVMSRSSPAVEAAAVQQPGSAQEQRQQQQQQQELDGNIAQQLAGEDISLGVVLGCGAHGKVYKAQWRGQPVAVKVLYHSGLRAAARAVHETDLMLRACHKNVVQTHHVLMWQRAKAVIDDCLHDFRPSTATQVQQQQQLQQHMLSPAAAGDHSLQEDFQEDPAAAAAAAADGEASLPQQQQPQSERRFSNLHIDNSNANGNVSACGVLDLSAGGADAADGWMGHAGMFVDDDEDELEAQTWIVQELCDGGPLDAAVRNGKIASTEVMVSCLLDVARGLEYLHSQGLMHGDLKAGNVCLVSANAAAAAAAVGDAAGGGASSAAICNGTTDACRDSNGSNAHGFDYVCKVMDFSLSKALDAGKSHCSTQSLGTITHMAPELLLTGKQSKAADVYSVGMLIWEVLHGGQTPFRECSHSMEVMQLVLAKQRPKWQPGCPPELVALAEQCWAAQPTLRPDISTVCEQLLQLQLTLQLQHIDMAGWPAGAWLLPPHPASAAGAANGVVNGAVNGAATQQGSSNSSSRRGSGSSSGSTPAASFYNVAAAAVAAAAEAKAAAAAESSSSSRPPAAPAGSTAAAVKSNRPPVRKSVSFSNASPAVARGLHAIPKAVTPRAVFQMPASPLAAAAAAAAEAPPKLQLPRSAGAVLQTLGSVQTLDQVLQAGLNPAGRSNSSSQLGAEAGRANGSSRATFVRRHSVAHVDLSVSTPHRELGNGLQACRSSDYADMSCVVEASTGADVSAMQAFENMLLTRRKAVARGVDCSALDVVGSQEEVRQSGSAWPMQQQQQLWRLSGSGVDAAPAAVSAGNTLSPMVGYWD